MRALLALLLFAVTGLQPALAQTPHTGTPIPTVHGTFPTAKRVPGKRNLVYSPFVQGKIFDIEGFRPGTQIRDPYSGKICLVP